MLKYHQESSSSSCLSSLASDFHIIGDNRAVNSLANFIEESLTFQKNGFRNIINFANDLMRDKLRHIGEQHPRYNMKKWKNKGAFNILNVMSENVTLVQLMHTQGNLNNAISIVGYCIFD